MSALYGTYARSPLAFERGEGVRLIAQDGTRYLDFHARHRGERARPCRPASGQDAEGGGREGLAHLQRLHDPRAGAAGPAAGRRDLRRLACSSPTRAPRRSSARSRRRGTTSSPRARPDRYEIIAFTGSFHGRTLGTIAAAGNPHYVEGFGPPLAGFTHVKPDDIKLVEAAITPKTCAILIEPVQGEGGVHGDDGRVSCAACARSATSTACC